MKTDQNLENILNIIRDIENKTIGLKNTDKIHKIEMDILLDRVRNLYNHLIDIDKEYPYDFSKGQEIEFQIRPESQPEPPPKQESAQEQQQEPAPKKVAKQAPQEKPEEEKHPEESISPDYEEEQETKKEHVSPQQPGEAPISSDQENKKENGPEIVAEKFQNNKTFRHDNLAKSQSKKDVSSKMQTKPIHDLTKAIGVNDKFLYIKELFNGEKEKYHEAIQILNELPTYEEAEKYLTESFNWDEEKQEVKKFFDLIRRKFKQNE